MLLLAYATSSKIPWNIEKIDNIASPTNGQLKCRLPIPSTTIAPKIV